MSDVMNSTQMQWFRSRLAWLLGGASHNGKRNYNEEFGYPSGITPQDYQTMYQRNGIASRIIRAFPQATFEEMPTIRDEAGDSSEELKANGDKNPAFSPFVKDVYSFFDKTQTLRYLERLDRVQGIGRFGILVMGFRDGAKLNTPLGAGKKQLIYLQAYGEPSAQIIRYDTDQTSARYGLPVMYRVQPGLDSESGDGVAPRAPIFEVHFSRVIHAAEFLDDSEVIGRPRLESVYNHLLDLQKTLGSGAETYWRQSNPGISFTADSDARIDAAVLGDMKKQVEEFENGLRRTLAMQGLTPHTLGVSQIADPTPVVDKLLEVIAGAQNMPKRILVGSERGELASSQDSDSWASTIDQRQASYATPQLVLPFVGKMIETGNILRPKGIVTVVWPDSGALSPKDQAEVGRVKTEALARYASVPAAEYIVPPQEFRRDFLGMEPESEFEIEEPEELPEIEGELTDDQAQLPAPGGDSVQNNERRVPKGIRLMARRAHMSMPAKPLYVRRDLLNAEEVRSHFKKQGIASMVEAAKMHVTIMFSRTPVDWFKMGEAWTEEPEGRLTVAAGGPRALELFGTEKDVLVLKFASHKLLWRHEDMKWQGAVWDYPDYNPHISLSWNIAEEYIDRQQIVEGLEPYMGELVFGPEVFEDIKVDWQKTIKENARA